MVFRMQARRVDPCATHVDHVAASQTAAEPHGGLQAVDLDVDGDAGTELIEIALVACLAARVVCMPDVTMRSAFS